MDGKWLHYQQCVAAVCTDLTVHNVAPFQSGQNSDLLLVNDDLLFRFPKFARGIVSLRREQAILNAVRLQLPLSVPHFIYHNLDAVDVGRAFVGYRKLPGEPLWTENFSQIDSIATVDRLAADLASFLQTLHAIPPHTVGFDLQPSDTQAAWSEIFARIRQIVFPQLTTAARSWTTRQFVPFLDNASNFACANVLRHGDFGRSNILYATQQQRLQAVTDFGHAGIGDPAVDFAGLYVSYGEPFLRKCASTYPLIDLCWERIRFFAGCAFLLEDALFCIENSTAEAAEVIAEVNRKAI